MNSGRQSSSRSHPDCLDVAIGVVHLDGRVSQIGDALVKFVIADGVAGVVLRRIQW